MSRQEARASRWSKLTPLTPTPHTEMAPPPLTQVTPTIQDIYRIVREVEGKRVEAKYLTTGASNAFGTSAFTYSSVVDVPQGSTDSQRIGDVVEPERLHFECHFQSQVASGNSDEVIRLVIFQWKPQFSLQPPTSTVLFKNDPFSTSITPFSEFIKDARSSFIVLYDKKIVMIPKTERQGVALAFHVKLSRALKDIQYVAGSTTDATNKIFICSACTTSVTPPTFTWRSQFEYWDQ